MGSGIVVMGTFKKVLKLEVVWCKTNTMMPHSSL